MQSSVRSWISKILILFFFLLSPWSSSYQYPLAICAIFKNEAPWLREWIVYHRDILGVKRFYLYNNRSTDEFAEVLQPFIEDGLVELIEWDIAYGPPFEERAMDHFKRCPPGQVRAYNDCLKKRALGKARWVAIIDVDEFIVPAKGVRAFYDFLRKEEKRNKGTVRLFWRIFGTSNVDKLNDGELLTEKLVWRSKDTYPWNRQVKSIHRPEAIDFCLTHEADALNKGYRGKTMPPSIGSIHHYWTRVESVCLEKRKKSKTSDPEFFEDLHQVKDETILQYVPIVKRGLGIQRQ